MTWNISNIKAVKLQDFKLNIQAIRDEIIIQKGIIELSDFKIFNNTLTFFDTLEIEGKIQGGLLEVTRFGLTGDRSGTIWRDILLPSFRSSIGSLSFVLIWEAGEEIERVVIKDGTVSSEEIVLE